MLKSMRRWRRRMMKRLSKGKAYRYEGEEVQISFLVLGYTWTVWNGKRTFCYKVRVFRDDTNDGFSWTGETIEGFCMTSKEYEDTKEIPYEKWVLEMIGE